MTEENFNPAYYNTIDQIFHFEALAEPLLRIRLLRQLIGQFWPEGHPTQLIHVAGTSGKGSVTRFLEAGLRLRFKAGTLTSPHLFDYRERFSLEGEPAPRELITAIWEEKLRPVCLDLAEEKPAIMPTFQETAVLIALSLFAETGIEWAAIEAGIGGRYDRTNAIDAAITVLTNVRDDHQALLGAERWQRALDKAGIARPGVPLFTTEDDPEQLGVIEGIAAHVGAPLTRIIPEEIEGLREEFLALKPELPPDALIGRRIQMKNAALALRVIQSIAPDLSRTQILQAFADVRFRGRFEEVEPGVIIDVSHNEHKIEALAEEISRRFPEKSVLFLVGLSKDRRGDEVLASLLPQAEQILITENFHEARAAEQVRDELATVNDHRVPLAVISDPARAYQRAKELRKPDGLLIITGSTYLIEQIFNPDPYMRTMNAQYGWRLKDGG